MDPQEHLDLARAIPGEDESWLKPGWLAGSDIDDDSRSVLVNWLIQVSSYLQLSDITLHLAVSHLDLVMNKVNVEMEEVQLMALACLQIAAKATEDSVPSPQLMLPLTGNMFTISDLARLEREVLVELNWRLVRQTPAVFLHYYSQIVGNKGRLFRLARAVLDLCLTQTWYGTIKPSILASTALLTASYLQGSGWSVDLATTTRHHPRQLMVHLVRVLSLLVGGQVGEGVREKHGKVLAKLGVVGQETVNLIIRKVEGESLRNRQDSRGFG